MPTGQGVDKHGRPRNLVCRRGHPGVIFTAEGAGPLRDGVAQDESVQALPPKVLIGEKERHDRPKAKQIGLLLRQNLNINSNGINNL